MQRPSELDRLQDLYQTEAERFAEAQRKSGMACPPTCGKCCQVPTVEASVFEMLPMAYTLFENGTAESVLNKIKTSETELCVMFEPSSLDPNQGRCGLYQDRPLVCRIFAVGARKDKYQQAEAILCRELKTLYPLKAQEYQGQAQQLPLMTDAFQRLAEIDPSSLQKRFRISIALGMALEKVLYLSQLVEGQRTENT